MTAQTTLIKIEGMSCNHCKAAVERALKQIDGVKDVFVDLDNKRAMVTHDPKVTMEVLARAVEKAGYNVLP
ncbi:heavy-metal-associated domain-containing protein [Desulfofundulus salinus]|uniref:Copper chaperone CopZ n=1 Tax=Desulfofundulus salinus TaxID=2419843 RepID=A0A494X2Q3_9FIRM|nr:heavy metal-associated domain-containing protein [Desulfofundulus salinum]RKO67200.1 heavy-metal-associated domain-containing protein [Desulfofundulus salinum]